MVSVEEAVVAKLNRKGHHFEILVDPERASDYRKGKTSLDSVLAVNGIFKDARKGERVSEKELEEAFQTRDLSKACSVILKEGEIQLTTEQRRQMVEEKKKQIAETISRQGVDPKTNAPHPPQRIINAMEETHVLVDPFKPATEQVEGVLEKIRTVLAISISKVEVAIKVPIQYSGKASSAIRQMAPVKKEEWSSSFWMAVIEIPAGMQAEILERLNELTSGQVESKVIRSV